MNREFYESVLEKNTNRTIDAEKMWDERAERFNAPDEKSHSGFTDETIAILEAGGMLEGTVLDIGGGGGRYAVPFARKARWVDMTDISGNMIHFAQKKAEREGVKNISFIKMDWNSDSAVEHGMVEKYDLVFASMCPAVKNKEGLRAMIRASARFGMISQFIRDTDTLAEFIRDYYALAPTYHPHQDREGLIAITNLLWLDGYNPSIVYLDDNRCNELTQEGEKAFPETYAALLARAEEESGIPIDTDALLDLYKQQYGNTVTTLRKVALISWDGQRVLRRSAQDLNRQLNKE